MKIRINWWFILLYMIWAFLRLIVIPFVDTVLNHYMPGLWNLSDRDKKSMGFSKILEWYHLCGDENRKTGINLELDFITQILLFAFDFNRGSVFLQKSLQSTCFIFSTTYNMLVHMTTWILISTEEEKTAQLSSGETISSFSPITYLESDWKGHRSPPSCSFPTYTI